MNGSAQPRVSIAVILMVVVLATASIVGAAAQDTATRLSLLQDAAQLILSGNLDKAESNLRKVLATDPEEFHALNFLGVIRAQQHKEREGEALFQRVIARKPKFVGAHVNLGHLYAQTKRDEEAAIQFQEALRLDPTRSDALSALVSVLRSQARAAVAAADLEKGLALLLRARKLSPQDPEVLFEFGMTALQMSLFPDAIQAFEESLAARKNNPDTLYGLGRAQTALSKLPEAKTSFAQFVELRPNDASGHYALGLVLQALQETVEARQHFEKSVELQPVQTEAYFQLGLIDLDEKELDSAANQFARVLQRDGKHAGALFGMGRVSFEKREYAAAVPWLEQATASDASLRQAHYYLGLTYVRIGRKDDSARELEIASRLEREEVEQHRIVLKILNPSDAGSVATNPAADGSAPDCPTTAGPQ